MEYNLLKNFIYETSKEFYGTLNSIKIDLSNQNYKNKFRGVYQKILSVNENLIMFQNHHNFIKGKKDLL